MKWRKGYAKAMIELDQEMILLPGFGPVVYPQEKSPTSPYAIKKRVNFLWSKINQSLMQEKSKLHPNGELLHVLEARNNYCDRLEKKEFAMVNKLRLQEDGLPDVDEY